MRHLVLVEPRMVEVLRDPIHCNTATNIGHLNALVLINVGHQPFQNTKDGKVMMSNFLRVILKVDYANVNRVIWTRTTIGIMDVKPRTVQEIMFSYRGPLVLKNYFEGLFIN